MFAAQPDALIPPDGMRFIFLEPENPDLLQRARRQALRWAAPLAPGVCLRRPGTLEDALLLEAGLLPAPLPPSLWDFQAQAGLYNLILRHQARVVLFDQVNLALPWLEQRPRRMLREAARFLEQLRASTGCHLVLIYQHSAQASRARQRRVMDGLSGYE